MRSSSAKRHDTVRDRHGGATDIEAERHQSGRRSHGGPRALERMIALDVEGFQEDEDKHGGVCRRK